VIWVHLAIVLAAIIVGARFGGIAIGLAGGAGVALLAATGLSTDPTKDVPWSVIGIIMCVISAISALQLAGAMDYLVHLTERLLRKHPKQITYLAPLVTYLLSMLAGTGHTAYSVLPVIVDVAKSNKIRPSRPLSIAVVASQVAVCASPISAATVAITSILTPLHVGYLQILAVVIPCTFIGCAVGAVVAAHQGCELEEDPVYRERVAKGQVSEPSASAQSYQRPASALPALWIFIAALVLAVAYSALTSEQLGLVKNPPMSANGAIMAVMMTAALIIVAITGKPFKKLTEQSTFKSGMTAAICILGVAWLGIAFVNGHIAQLQSAGAGFISHAPWLLSVVLYLAGPFLYSHAAVTVAFMPAAVAIGLQPVALLACYPAVSNYYLFPTYPTTIAAMEMDDTGSTRVGKFVLAHPFVIPGTVSIAVTVALGFVLAPLVL
jgi:anaerobic C4-dicarboxylate transporter DcuA